MAEQKKIKPFESLMVKSLTAEELKENKNNTYVKLILKNKRFDQFIFGKLI